MGIFQKQTVLCSPTWDVKQSRDVRGRCLVAIAETCDQERRIQNTFGLGLLGSGLSGSELSVSGLSGSESGSRLSGLSESVLSGSGLSGSSRSGWSRLSGSE